MAVAATPLRGAGRPGGRTGSRPVGEHGRRRWPALCCLHYYAESAGSDLLRTLSPDVRLSVRGAGPGEGGRDRGPPLRIYARSANSQRGEPQKGSAAEDALGGRGWLRIRETRHPEAVE